MPVLKQEDFKKERLNENLKRTVVHLDNLMMAILEFSGGPWPEPDPFHSHVHEQISYVVDGEIIFSCEGEPDERLTSGDVFYASSGKKHRIQLISPQATLIDNFTPIREDFIDK